MARILVIQAPSRDEGGDGWPTPFDEVIDGALDDVASRWAVMIPADAITEVPRVTGGTRVAFLCRSLDGLEHAVRLDLPGDLVFAPSALGRLDGHRRRRLTMRAARPLGAGDRLTADAIGTEVGGAGLSADLKDAVIGRTLFYKLDQGEPIDFGVLEEDHHKGNGGEP